MNVTCVELIVYHVQLPYNSSRVRQLCKVIWHMAASRCTRIGRSYSPDNAIVHPQLIHGSHTETTQLRHDVCSNRPHSMLCMRCGLIISTLCVSWLFAVPSLRHWLRYALSLINWKINLATVLLFPPTLLSRRSGWERLLFTRLSTQGWDNQRIMLVCQQFINSATFDGRSAF